MKSSLRYHLLNNFRKTDEQLMQKFAERGVYSIIGRYRFGHRDIRFVESGQVHKPPVMFVHGAPGSLDAFLEYLTDPELLDRCRMISVDRPGFGDSGYGQSVPSIKAQAEMLQPLLGLVTKKEPALLVGHSYGGAIVAHMAMDAASQVKGLLMLAPAVDPLSEKVYWVSYPANWRMFRWLLPGVWKVTNDEKLRHRAALKAMEPLWSKINLPTTIIQGNQDRLVSPAHAEYLQREMLNSHPEVQLYPDLDHMIPWKGKKIVKKAILRYLG